MPLVFIENFASGNTHIFILVDYQLPLMHLSVCGRKAKRCYQKAFELDRQSADAGSCLVDIMMRLDEKVTDLHDTGSHTCHSYYLQ